MTLTMDHDPEEDAGGPIDETTKAVDEAAESTDETAAEETESDEYSHLDDLADGAGCTEIWEHLSDSREE